MKYYYKPINSLFLSFAGQRDVIDGPVEGRGRSRIFYRADDGSFFTWIILIKLLGASDNHVDVGNHGKEQDTERGREIDRDRQTEVEG